MNDSHVAQMAVFVAPSEGVAVLREVFHSLHGGFPGAIVILLHAGTGGERSIADNLNVASNFMILKGEAGTALRNGHGYVVEASSDLALGADGVLMKADGRAAHDDALLFGSSVENALASESVLASLAARYGKNGVAVALTALDGAEQEGFRRVREAGGHTIALDEADRLWADSRGPRVVPHRGDETLSTAALGARMLQMASAA